MQGTAELAGLFATAFFAATLLPGGSEALLIALHLGGAHSTASLLAAASLGNVLGTLVNWLFGRYLTRFQDRRWFPVSPRQLARASRWYRRWGVWSLLLAWLPLIGDPLSLVAGLMRAPLWLFLVLVSIGKVARYAAVLAVF